MFSMYLVETQDQVIVFGQLRVLSFSWDSGKSKKWGSFDKRYLPLTSFSHRHWHGRLCRVLRDFPQGEGGRRHRLPARLRHGPRVRRLPPVVALPWVLEYFRSNNGFESESFRGTGSICHMHYFSELIGLSWPLFGFFFSLFLGTLLFYYW